MHSNLQCVLFGLKYNLENFFFLFFNHTFNFIYILLTPFWLIEMLFFFLSCFFVFLIVLLLLQSFFNTYKSFYYFYLTLLFCYFPLFFLFLSLFLTMFVSLLCFLCNIRQLALCFGLASWIIFQLALFLIGRYTFLIPLPTRSIQCIFISFVLFQLCLCVCVCGYVTLFLLLLVQFSTYHSSGLNFYLLLCFLFVFFVCLF